MTAKAAALSTSWAVPWASDGISVGSTVGQRLLALGEVLLDDLPGMLETAGLVVKLTVELSLEASL